MKKSILLLATAAMVWGLSTSPKASAQSLSDNGIFYHSFTSPWAGSLNPAFFPSNTLFYVTLPRVGADLSLPFSYNDLGLQYDPTRQATVFNVTDFLHRFDENPCRLNTNADIGLLGVGLSLGESLHLTASAGLRSNNTVTIPVELTRLVTEGNMNEERHLELGTSTLFHSMTYAYASVGLVYSHSEIPLTLGARFNLLDGIQIASIERIGIDMITSPDTSTVSLALDYMARFGGTIDLESAFDMANTGVTPTIDASLIPQNLGYSIDLGAKFSLHNFDFSASLLDLGQGINWGNNIQTITPKDPEKTFQFDGIEVENLLDTAFYRGLLDSVMQMADYKLTDESFWYAPPTKCFIGASYTLGSSIRLGYLFHGEWSNGWLRPADRSSEFRANNSFSANVKLLNFIEVGVANSFSYDGTDWTFFNPGMSLSLNLLNAIQIYAAVDYVSSFYLAELKSAHAYLGLNITVPTY